jgi:hypothetical protein
MSTATEDKLLGDVDFSGKDISIGNVKFDKIAVSDRGELLLISIVADTQRVKQIRAILAGGAKAVISAAGVKTTNASFPWRRASLGRLYPSQEGYQCFTHKIGYGMAHALFLTRTPGFMKVVNPESLWNEINDVRFTTPIIKEWVPYIEKKLRETNHLEDANVFNCKCGVLSATSNSLDDVISEGLKLYEIRIPTNASV